VTTEPSGEHAKMRAVLIVRFGEPSELIRALVESGEAQGRVLLVPG
jgi:hypothetical protein